PNILAVHDVGDHEGKPYIVTELLEGETLQARLAPGAIPPEAAQSIARQIAQGLAAAHAKGIVHRDLKPANLFLTRDGRVKILDFGVAKLLLSGHGTLTEGGPAVHTRTGVPIGTPAYMSPEQLRGEPVDERSDLFSFGCVLHEMLAGSRPFSGNSIEEMAAAILRDAPAPLPSQVPAQLARVVARCLEKLPGQRFQSAVEMSAALADP